MDKLILEKSINKIYSDIAIMSDNLSYIQSHLSELKLSSDHNKFVTERCNNFESALYDVKSEIRNLTEKLSSYPRSDPKVTIKLIYSLLIKEVESTHQMVIKLREDEKADQTNFNLQGLNILANESAANILIAYKDIDENLEIISSQLKLIPLKNPPEI